MRWPFGTEQDTDLRMYRDPKTNEPTLKMQGQIDLSPLKIGITLTTNVTREAALRLRDQIDIVFGHDTPTEDQTDGEGLVGEERA
jgi:hypothetical protein